MEDGYAVVNGVKHPLLDAVQCESDPQREVMLTPAGKVMLCRELPYKYDGRCTPFFGSALKGARTVSPGAKLTAGRFRCLALQAGIECTISRTGVGFLFSKTKISRVR